MELSVFVIRIAFIALPGLIAMSLYRKARGRVTKQPWEEFFEIMFFSLMSYLILALIIGTHNYLVKVLYKPEAVMIEGYHVPVDNNYNEKLNKYWHQIDFLKIIDDEKPSLNWHEIGCACIISVFLALGCSYLHTYSIITWIFRRLKASKKVADEDVWELFFQGNTPDWLYVRDHKLDLIYYGNISYFSDSNTERELIIENVSVYNNGSEPLLLYETPKLYLSRDKFDITIELISDQTKKENEITKEQKNVQ